MDTHGGPLRADVVAKIAFNTINIYFRQPPFVLPTCGPQAVAESGRLHRYLRCKKSETTHGGTIIACVFLFRKNGKLHTWRAAD